MTAGRFFHPARRHSTAVPVASIPQPVIELDFHAPD